MKESNDKLYKCKDCDYTTYRKNDYIKHKNTVKHKVLKDDNMYICECGKKYLHKQSLSRHKKNSNCGNLVSDMESCFSSISSNNSICKKIEVLVNDSSKDEVICLLKELVSMNKEIVEENKNIKEKMIEITKKPLIINNTFNLNNFLTIQCKDAPTLKQFINGLSYSIDNVQYVKEHGLINGLKKDVYEKLKDMDQTLRPIHSTDKHRNTIYFKSDNDEWLCDKEQCADLSIELYTNQLWKELRTWRILNNSKSYDYENDVNTDFFHEANIVICQPSYEKEHRELLCKHLRNMYGCLIINKKYMT